MNSNDNKTLEEYTKINARLTEALDLLTLLNEEREKIIKLAEGGITPEIQELMETSLKSFETLSKYVDSLKKQAEELKK